MYSGLNEENSQCGSLVTEISSSSQCSASARASAHIKPTKLAKFHLSPPLSPPLEGENMMADHTYVLKHKAANVDFLALRTISTSTTIEKTLTDSTVTEQRVTQQSFSSTDAIEIEDEEALAVKTVSMHAVEIKQAKKKVGSFFFNVLVLLAGILLLGMLTIFIILVPELIYKIEIFILALVGFSYLASIEVKCIYRTRRQKYLTATQIVPTTRKKATSSASKDMKHFSYLTQDTEAFLLALTVKKPKEEAH